LHFTKIVNGGKTEYHLCDICAREKGDVIPGTPNGFSIHNLLSGLMDFEPGIKSATGKTPPPLRCEDCGLTYIQFSKLGRFGCAKCYDHFRHKLEPMLKRIHGQTTHTGKVPKRSGGVMQIKREIERLKFQMHQAIEQEEFERAAQIRDQVRAIEQQLRESASGGGAS
jgi:protein arginine kinase activator